VIVRSATNPRGHVPPAGQITNLSTGMNPSLQRILNNYSDGEPAVMPDSCSAPRTRARRAPQLCHMREDEDAFRAFA